MAEQYSINKFFSKKLNSKNILITTRHGSWCVVSERDYDLLRNKKVHENKKLFRLLEDRGIIITRYNINKITEIYNKKYAFLSRHPALHIISPTKRCNHECVYCCAKSSQVNTKKCDMDKDTARNVVDFIFQSPNKSLTIEFQGGEPLINFPVIEYIVEYSKRLARKKNKNIKYRLATNLTLMNDDILKFLIKNNFRISTSLDGPKELHNKNRKYLGTGDGHGQVVYWIERIKEDFKYSVNAQPTITKFSLPYSKEIIDEYLRLGLRRIRLKPMFRLGRADDAWDEIAYRPEEFFVFWKNSLEYILKLSKRSDVRENMTEIILDKIFHNKINYMCHRRPCGFMISQLAYGYDGSIYGCDNAKSFEEFKMGNVKNMTYKALMSTPAYVRLRCGKDIYICDQCVWSPFCGICEVATPSNYNKPTPKVPSSFFCTIRKMMIEYIFKKLLFSSDKSILQSWIN